MKYTAEALKARPDYKFSINGLDYLIPEIRRGVFDSFDPENGRFDNGVATLEVGYLSLDVNVTSCEIHDGDEYLNKPVVSYFLYVKGIDKGKKVWGDGGYMDDVGFITEVDFNCDDWKEQLEADMVTKLIAIAEEYKLHFNTMNFFDGDTFCVMDKIFNPAYRFGVYLQACTHKEFYASFLSEEQAKKFCEDNRWVYVDSNGFEWSLYIDERW